MKRHFLYDEFEKENYSFLFIRNSGQLMPKVINNSNLDDFCFINTAVTVNGQAQLIAGPQCSTKTTTLLQKLLDVVYNSNTVFIDYDFTVEE
jgi:hypothetical protein